MSSLYSPLTATTTSANLTFIFYLRKCKGCFYLISGVSLFYIILCTMKMHDSVLHRIQNFRVSTDHQSNNISISNINSSGNGSEEVKNELACVITKLEPFDPEIREALLEDEYEEKLRALTCQEIYPYLFNSSVDPYPRLIPVKSLAEFGNMTVASCCYRTFHRGNPENPQIYPDHSFTFSKECYPVSLENFTIVGADHEFISIECQHQKPILKEPENVLNAAEEMDIETDDYETTIVDMHAFVHPPSPPKKAETGVSGDVASSSSSIPPTTENGNEKLNVLVIGLDAMARMNFIRRFPKSYDYLMTTLFALEMEMYNKIGDNTLPNVGPLLTNHQVVGETNLTCEVNRTYDNCPFIWDKFAKEGFHTLLAEDDRRLGNFDYLKNGFMKQPTENYFRTFNSAADKHIASQKLLFAKICYGPRFAYQVMLDYVKKMTFVMSNANKNFFGFTWTNSLTHDFLNAGLLVDDHLHEFLKWINDGGYLNNTVLIVMGDHGARWGPIRSYYQGQLEERLPAMYFVLPPWFQEKYSRAYRNLMTNRKRLVTVWDLHQTFLDLVNIKDSISEERLAERESELPPKLPSPEAPGISMFLPISPARTCKLAGIPDAYCTCNHRILHVPITDPEVQLGANFAVAEINEFLLEGNFTKCANLTLATVKSAGKVSFGEMKIWQGYQLNFQTEPGGGLFETLVVHDEMELAESNWTLPGKILRTNLYDSQSWCVDDKLAKLYCYCV